MAMGYTDRTNDFTNLVDRAAQRAREDTALAEEARGRATASLYAIPGQAVEGAVSGYMKGRGFSEESAARKQQMDMQKQQMGLADIQTQAAQNKLAEDQRRTALMTTPGLQNKPMASMTPEEQALLMPGQEFGLRKQEFGLAQRRAGSEEQRLAFEMEKQKKLDRIAQGSALLQGKLAMHQANMGSYSAQQAEAPYTGAPTLANFSMQQPQQQQMPTYNQDQMIADLVKTGMSHDEAYMAMAPVLQQSQGQGMAEGVDDTTSGLAAVREKSGHYANALTAINEAKKVYENEGRSPMDSVAAEQAIQKVKEALKDVPGGEVIARTLDSGIAMRTMNWLNPLSSEKNITMKDFLNQFANQIQAEARNDINVGLRSLPPRARSNQRALDIQRKWSENGEFGNIVGNDRVIPKSTTVPALMNGQVKQQQQLVNFFDMQGK